MAEHDDAQDYEAIRQENIRKNAELMLSLGLDSSATRLRPPSPERKAPLPKKRHSPVPKEEEDDADLPQRKSSRLAGTTRRSMREQDLHPSIHRDRSRPERVFREGSRKSSRNSAARTRYKEWDSDEDEDSDGYVPRWRGGSRSRSVDNADNDEDEDDAESGGSDRKSSRRTFDLSGRPILKKLSNPEAPPLPTSGGDEVYRTDAPRPSRQDMPRGKGKGALRFEREFRQFAPNVTPEEMLRGGAFGGTAFRDYHSKVLQKPIDVDAELAELPQEWLEGLDVDEMLRSSQLDPSKNKFRVKAGQSLEEWEKAGWIRPLDARGWFQWYYRFYLGRRSADDARQISRWLKACGPGGRFRKALAQNVAVNGGRWDDPKVNAVVRQTLWQWGYELTEADYRAYFPS